MSTNQNHEKELVADMMTRFQEGAAAGKFAGMNAEGIFKKMTSDMLASNPFVPPEGCPIQKLPTELLAHIFYLGVLMEEDDDDENDDEHDDVEDGYIDEIDLVDGWETSDGDEEAEENNKKETNGDVDMAEPSEDGDLGDGSDEEEEDDEPQLPFQVLVSHVCKHWREVALNTQALWTALQLSYGVSLDRVRAWIDRSKSLPISIYLNCVAPDGYGPPDTHRDGVDKENDHVDLLEAPPYLSDPEVQQILDIIQPEVQRWRVFEVQATFYTSIYPILERLSECPPALMLEALRFYYYEECNVEEFSIFQPTEMNTRFRLFGGSLPELKNLALWGVHLDWEACLSFFNKLQDLELSYHPGDVCPKFETFARMLASPKLEVLSLCLSGPSRDPQKDWGSVPIDLSPVTTLALCHHEPEYIEALYPLFYLPNVHHLTLDYEAGDYSNFGKMLATPQGGSSRSILANLVDLKISSFTCDLRTKGLMLEQLVNIPALHLNCFGDEEAEFLQKLMELKKPQNNGASTVAYCPALKEIWTIGVDGKAMRKLVDARKKGGAPLRMVMMSQEDDVEDKEENWLRSNVEEFDFFEPSDSEEEIDDDDLEFDEDDEDSDA